DGQEIGDPTEVALIDFCNKNNKDYREIRSTFKREAELPFDSDRKLMSTLHTFNSGKTMLTKGGPDVMFKRCSSVYLDGKVQPLTPEILQRFQKANEEFSMQALRVLACGYKRIPDRSEEHTSELQSHENIVCSLL